MSTFNEGEHPREGTGKFTTKQHQPADTDLGGTGPGLGGEDGDGYVSTPDDGDYQPHPGPDSYRPGMAQYVRRESGDLHGNAYNMKAHSWRESLHHRDIVAPKAIGVFGVKEPVEWKDTTTAQKLAYIDGYAAALEAAEDAEERGGKDWYRTAGTRDRGFPTELIDDDQSRFTRNDGWRRGIMVAQFRTEITRNGHMPDHDVVIARTGTRQGMVKVTDPSDMGGGLIQATVKEQPPPGVYGESPDKVGNKVLFRADEVYGWT